MSSAVKSLDVLDFIISIYILFINDYINEKNIFDTFSKLFKSILTLFVLTTNIIPDS